MALYSITDPTSLLPRANSSKVWTFGTSGVGQALPASYEERGPGGTALMHTDYTWTTDSVNNVSVGTVLNTQIADDSMCRTHTRLATAATTILRLL